MWDYNKRQHLVTRIDEANQDSKQLFRALISLLGNRNESPLPCGTTNDQLAKDFADFFLNTIDKIREGFKNIPAYQPRQLDSPKLKKFTPVTQHQLEKIVRTMPAKTCELDIIPTDRFKQVLEGCLPALTHKANRLLDTNQFCEEGKEYWSNTLIKKHQLG